MFACHASVRLDIPDDLPVIVAIIFDDSQADLQAAGAGGLRCLPPADCAD